VKDGGEVVHRGEAGERTSRPVRPVTHDVRARAFLKPSPSHPRTSRTRRTLVARGGAALRLVRVPGAWRRRTNPPPHGCGPAGASRGPGEPNPARRESVRRAHHRLKDTRTHARDQGSSFLRLGRLRCRAHLTSRRPMARRAGRRGTSRRGASETAEGWRRGRGPSAFFRRGPSSSVESAGAHTTGPHDTRCAIP
jgi:hypothetical protein